MLAGGHVEHSRARLIIKFLSSRIYLEIVPRKATTFHAERTTFSHKASEVLD